MTVAWYFFVMQVKSTFTPNIYLLQSKKQVFFIIMIECSAARERKIQKWKMNILQKFDWNTDRRQQRPLIIIMAKAN